MIFETVDPRASLCHCGRELKLLNEASQTPKCVGCGYTPDLCPCDRAPR